MSEVDTIEEVCFHTSTFVISRVFETCLTLSTLEGNMTGGNKTTCRNMLLPADNNRIACLPTGICHLYQDTCYEQLTSLEEPKFRLYSCREVFCHTKKTHFDTHANRLHFTGSQWRSEGISGDHLLQTPCSKESWTEWVAQDIVQPLVAITCSLILRLVCCSASPCRISGWKSLQEMVLSPSAGPASGYASAAVPSRE